MKRTAFKFILLALTQLLNKASRSRPAFRAALKQHDCVVQFRLKDGTLGRHYFIAAGKFRVLILPHANDIFNFGLIHFRQ